MIQLNRKDVIRFYNIDRPDEGLFWAKLDTLIETTAVAKHDENFLF